MRIHTIFPAPAPSLTLLQLCKKFHRHAWQPFLFLLLFLSFIFPATAQPSPPQDAFAKMKFDKTMASVLVILVMVFFTLGFISIYTRQCRERRIRGRVDLTAPVTGGDVCRQPRGLDPTIIENFPKFVYSEVKDLKIGRVTLECAVCLNEFADDETLRLIPNCSHVFHRDCVDVWLLHHSTCPVCRAELVPGSDDAGSSVQIQISEPNLTEPVFNHEPDVIEPVGLDEKKKVLIVSPSVNFDGMNRTPVRSMSVGFGFMRLFSRSKSTGQLMVRSDEDCERFTLRLPDEVHNRLMNDITLRRTKTWDATLRGGKRGYRTRSVGRNFLQYERFNVESRLDQKGFTCAPSFLGRVGSMRSTKDGNNASATMGVMDKVDAGERSSDRLV